jgi:hypothetical protein
MAAAMLLIRGCVRSCAEFAVAVALAVGAGDVPGMAVVGLAVGPAEPGTLVNVLGGVVVPFFVDAMASPRLVGFWVDVEELLAPGDRSPPTTGVTNVGKGVKTGSNVWEPVMGSLPALPSLLLLPPPPPPPSPPPRCSCS